MGYLAASLRLNSRGSAGYWRNANPVSPAVFCQIQPAIGSLNQQVALAAVFRKGCHSGADRDRAWNSGELPRFHRSPQFFGYGECVIRIGLRQHNYKFLASVPADYIDLPQLLGKNRRYLPQHLVPKQVSELIIQTFEVININHDH
jgi:hypothetical protein